jgi:hypothetical protein
MIFIYTKCHSHNLSTLAKVKHNTRGIQHTQNTRYKIQHTQNASNIEMKFTIILDLYPMEQGPMPFGSQLVW